MFEYIHCNKYQFFLPNSNQQTQSYKFISRIAAFLSVVLITEILEICIQTSYDQNIQLTLKSYLPVVLGTTLKNMSCVLNSISIYIVYFRFGRLNIVTMDLKLFQYRTINLYRFMRDHLYNMYRPVYYGHCF